MEKPSIKRKPPKNEDIEKAIVRPGEGDSDDRTVSLRCGHCDQSLLTVARKPSSGKLETVWVECSDCEQWNELEKPAPDKAAGQYVRSIPTDWTFSENAP